MSFERSQHRVTALAVDLAEGEHVAIEEAAPRRFEGYMLAEAARVQIGALLGLNQARDHLLRRHDPAEAEARRQGLRERAEVEHAPAERAFAMRAAVELGVELHEGRQVASFVAELAVRIVLDDR